MMSMIGRLMLGKIEFKIRDTLKDVIGKDVVDQYLGGKDVVLAGDPKQAPPIIDEPMYREGEYEGEGQKNNFNRSMVARSTSDS